MVGIRNPSVLLSLETQSVITAVIKRSCWGHCSILIIYLTVYKAGPFCVVVVGIKMLPYCLFKDTIKMAANKRLFWVTILSLSSSSLWSASSC
jgi:hypothetical protein